MNRRLNLLVAEDNADDRKLLWLAFEKAEVGASVRFVTDGEEAITYLSGSGDYGDRVRFPFPQLMLLDLRMPRRDGFEVLAWVRATPACGCLPVVVLSSSGFDEDVQRAFALGANGYLIKTSNWSQLVEVARSLDAYWVRHNVYPVCLGVGCSWTRNERVAR
jgi:CheY-like chemotaxis protein